jgi:DNA-binding GntR family transcriptional regulator
MLKVFRSGGAVTFTPVRSSGLKEGIYDQVLDAIVSGRLEPGSPLTLESISQQFDVSIMPVREALRKLEATKLVIRNKNRTLSVTRLSAQDIKEIMEARLLLEAFVGGQAAVMRSEEAVERLEGLVKEMAAATTHPERRLVLNNEFHFTIYAEAKRPVLTEIIQSLWDRFSPYLFILHREHTRWPRDSSDKIHEEILNAVKNKDVEQVKHWLAADLQRSAQNVMATMEQLAQPSTRSDQSLPHAKVDQS